MCCHMWQTGKQSQEHRDNPLESKITACGKQQTRSTSPLCSVKSAGVQSCASQSQGRLQVRCSPRDPNMPMAKPAASMAPWLALGVAGETLVLPCAPVATSPGEVMQAPGQVTSSEMMLEVLTAAKGL